MSRQFYDLLSDHIKVGIRLIDHITLKGGHKPLRVIDGLPSALHRKLRTVLGADGLHTAQGCPE